ncbi:hypothetical protein RI129_009345 [Pyrocoelia pectoralis]|uniref:Serine/threonine-protein phosphatase n=1 Tax=Pyrocoelia pectoralis TaxID=417401 RepID=A0AAN7V5W3_9COLE
MFKAVSDLTDVVSHVIFCPDDVSMLITLEPHSNEYWIPSSKITPGTGWFAQSVKDMEDIFGVVYKTQKMLKLYKVWVPHHVSSYIYHCIYFVLMPGEQRKRLKTTYGKYRGKVRWVQESDLQKMLQQENLRSPEVLEFLRMCKGAPHSMLSEGVNISIPYEVLSCDGLVELTDYVLINSPNSGNCEQIIESASYTKNVQMALYKEFVFMCFPAIYMCQQVFSRLVTCLGWSKDDGADLFRAADVSGRWGITFRELLYILAALEPSTSHGGIPAELRCRYMFKFFDHDDDDYLSLAEFKLLISAIRKSKKQSLDATSVSKDADAALRTIGLSPGVDNLSLSDFLRAVGELKLRGTSQIFRSSIGIQQYLYGIEPQGNRRAHSRIAFTIILSGTPMKSGGNFENYSLGSHVVKLQKSGTLISVEQINEMAVAVSPSSTQQPTTDSKRLSQDLFAQISLPNEVLSSLRALIQSNRNLKPPAKGGKVKEVSTYDWGQFNPAHFGKNLILICSQVRDILKGEDRMINVQAPSYVLGDLHGNFASLLYFERILWHLGPGLCPCNILFLGDYVDRGPHSMEVIAYLFANKVQAPRKLMLLRGNHEIREIQKLFTFYTECLLKFGDKLGVAVWNAINSAFDAMPLAANIDGKVFCCHGGIPPPWLCPTVMTINSIPCPLGNPDEQSALAWELMWNDPIRTKQIAEELILELQANDGFAVNNKRGTGHMFSYEALERFLNTNGYSHLIRAHEVAVSGFNLVQKGKVLTVFSSAKYCGGTNEAACILVDQGKLRVLKVETS